MCSATGLNPFASVGPASRLAASCAVSLIESPPEFANRIDKADTSNNAMKGYNISAALATRPFGALHRGGPSPLHGLRKGGDATPRS